MGCCELLGQTELTPEQTDYILTARACGDMLSSVISDILDLSKLEMGKMTLESRPFSLATVLEDVFLIARPKVCVCVCVCVCARYPQDLVRQTKHPSLPLLLPRAHRDDLLTSF